MRLSVLDRKASAILFLKNYEDSNGHYGLHVHPRGARAPRAYMYTPCATLLIERPDSFLIPSTRPMCY